MLPTNVVGMNQHADDGVLASTPYVSGGAHLNKMSDHCGDCDYDPEKRVGDLGAVLEQEADRRRFYTASSRYSPMSPTMTMTTRNALGDNLRP